MYIDFSQTNDSIFEADICIIGAGAAGFSCALSLMNSDIKVLVIEGGLDTYNEQAADLHQGEVVNHPHSGIHEARERIVGGTTTKWGGQAYPFMREDFETRAYVPLSGWPITLDDLLPYYHNAEQILGTDESVPFTYRPWKHWKITEPAFSSSKIDLFVTKWCKVPNFAQQHGSKLERSINVHLLRNANAVELLPSALLNSVKALRIRSLDGKEGQIFAKYIIAAGGALETVRLFLASKKFGDKGVANEHGLVGRYFQDHVAAIVGQIFPKSNKLFHEVFDPFYQKGFKYFPRIRLRPSYAKQLKILHASSQIVFSEDNNEVVGAMKTVVSNLRKKQLPNLKSLKSIIRPMKILQVGNAAYRWKIGKRGTSANGPIWLEIHSEQDPSKTNYVDLDSNTDALGMPRIRLHWNISELTIRTIREMAKLIKSEFEIADIGSIVLEPWTEEATENPARWMSDVYHQAGGLRMAETRDKGVVNSDCQVFGISNLFVASSAVFPTSSFSNPTMTTIALAIRISHMVAQLITSNQSSSS